MDPVKIQGIANWPTLISVKQVQSFLGFCNFYCPFIYHFSHIAQPLNQLTKKDTPWEWGEEQWQHLRCSPKMNHHRTCPKSTKTGTTIWNRSQCIRICIRSNPYPKGQKRQMTPYYLFLCNPLLMQNETKTSTNWSSMPLSEPYNTGGSLLSWGFSRQVSLPQCTMSQLLRIRWLVDAG